MTSITSSLPKVTSSTAKVTSITDDTSLKVSSGSYSQSGPFLYHQKLSGDLFTNDDELEDNGWPSLATYHRTKNHSFIKVCPWGKLFSLWLLVYSYNFFNNYKIVECFIRVFCGTVIMYNNGFWITVQLISQYLKNLNLP